MSIVQIPSAVQFTALWTNQNFLQNRNIYSLGGDCLLPDFEEIAIRLLYGSLKYSSDVFVSLSVAYNRT